MEKDSIQVTEKTEQINQKNNKTLNKNQPKQSKGKFANIIIDMMKKIRKNSPLFKPIKKLKTSIQAIGGQEKVSFYDPTNTLIVFHFGLGNDIDKEIVLNGTTLNKQNQQNKILAKDFLILPGKAFSFIHFKQTQNAQKFIEENQFQSIFAQLENQKNEQKKTQDQQIIQKLDNQNKKNQEKSPLFYFKEIQYKNLQRLMIFFFLKSTNKESQKEQQQSFVNIPNCPSKYGESNDIPGLNLIEQFITKQEELKLLQWIDSQPWQKLSNRRVQHYGFQFKYGRNQVDKEEKYKNKMPQVFHFLLQRLSKLVYQLSGEQIDYDQLTINDYFAGHGIPSHFDTHSPFEEFFVAISMLSGIVMDWKKYDGTEKSTYLKQRSTVVFSGEARYAWLHSIACRKLDNVDNQLKHRSRRLSLTFRKIKRTPCNCKYYFFCDSQGYNQQTMKKNNPLLTKYLCEQNEQKLKNFSNQKIYNQFVVKAYNSFGYDFHNKVIPQIKEYLQIESQKLQKSDPKQVKLIVDIGCGNGEYKKHLKSDKFYYLGVERCEIMIPVQDQVHMDGMRLGLKDESFDIVLLIAVLHHFTTEKDRLKCLDEAKRVLKSKSGVMYLTVFNYEGKKQQYPSQDILLDYCLPTHKVLTKQEQGKQSFQQKPIIPQNLQKQQGKKTEKGEIFTRYYHLFKKEEVEDLINKVGLQILQIKTSKQNIAVKLSKQ